MDLLTELQNTYPDATCELEYGNEFELLISVILSAQCTDKRVNAVTRDLFKLADTPQAFCDMPIEQLEVAGCTKTNRLTLRRAVKT